MGKIVGLYVGIPKTLPSFNGEFVSAIRKAAVEELTLTKEGIIGDGVADLKHHGGSDRVVCVYPYEHYELWEKERGEALAAPAFGENLSVTGMLEEDIRVGDIYQIGEAKLEVSQTRIPCYTISLNNNYPPLLKRVVETGFTGYFFRVLQEGKIRANSTIELIEKNHVGKTIMEINKNNFKP